jgi:hypothetical protein
LTTPARVRTGWRRAAGAAFVVIAFLFLGSFIVANVRQLRDHEWTLRPGMLALSLVVQMAGLYSGALAWQLQLRRMGTRAPLLDLARIRFVSGLARFVPGKVWPFISAARLGSGAGMAPVVTVTSILAHTVFALIAALLTAALFLPLEVGALGIRLSMLRWLAPALLVLAHPRIIGVALALVARLSRQQVSAWTGSWLDGIGLVALSVAGWLITGAALCAFIVSVTPLPASAFTAVIGINAFAWVVGQVVFIAPAGLGAKDGAVAALLALFVAAPVAALIAVAVRLWSTLAEVILAAALVSVRAPRPG